MTILTNANGQMEVVLDFPIFADHKTAASWGCQSCAGKLYPEDAQDKGYPPKRGRYGLKCRKCEATLFYCLSSEVRA